MEAGYVFIGFIVLIVGMNIYEEYKKKKGGDTQVSQVSEYKPVVQSEDVFIESLRYLTYPEYLKSLHWQSQKAFIRNKFQHRCATCNDKYNLHVHHRTYKNIKTKIPEREDLVLLCSNCHSLIHKHRPIDGKIRC